VVGGGWVMLLKMEMCFLIFFTNLFGMFTILRRTERDVIINVLRSSGNVTLILGIL